MLTAVCRCRSLLREDHRVYDAKPPVIFLHAARLRHLRYHDLMHVDTWSRDQGCVARGCVRWCQPCPPLLTCPACESVAVCASDLVMRRLELDVWKDGVVSLPWLRWRLTSSLLACAVHRIRSIWRRHCWSHGDMGYRAARYRWDKSSLFGGDRK